jgi:PAS domain S-box-containing protein
MAFSAEVEAALSARIANEVSITQASPGLASLLGYGVDEMIADRVRFFDHIHPDDGDLKTELLAQTPSRCLQPIHLRIRKADGRMACVQASYQKTIQDGVIHLSLQLQIPKTIPAALTDSVVSVQFQAVLDNSPDFIAFKDRNHRFTGVSQSLLALSGLASARADFVGKSDYDLFPEATADVYYRLEKQLFSGEPVAQQLQLVRDREGRECWLDERYYPLYAASGEIIGLYRMGRDVSAQVELENPLQDKESRQFSQQVLDSLSAHIAVLDQQGRIIFTNQAWQGFAQANGASLERCGLGASYLQQVDEGCGQVSAADRRAMDRIRLLLNGVGEPFMHEYPCCTASAELWFQMRVSPMVYQGQQGLVVSHLEITSRVKAERRLQREKEAAQAANRTLELTEQALDHTGIGEFWVDAANGRLLRVNQAGSKLLGYRRDEFLRMGLADIDPDFNSPAHRALHQDLIAKGWGRFETQHRHKSGGLMPVEITAKYLKARYAGERDMFITFVQDISQRKAVEQRLQRINEQLRLTSMVAEQTDNGVILTDLDQRILWVNQGFTRITGYSAEEVIGQTPRLFQGEGTASDARSRLSAAIAGRNRVELEIMNYRKDGTPHWINLEITPLRDDAGKVVQFIGLQRDVTEQRRAAEELIKAKEEAESANRAKSTFLAIMSHEIRTPLHGIVSTIDMLNHDQLTPGQRDLVHTARDSSQTLLGVINDILDFSKIEAGRLSLEHEPVAPGELLEAQGDSLRSLAEAQGVELLLYADPNLPPLLADPLRLRQIIFNLAGNGIKFSSGLANRRGRVFIGLRLLQRLADRVRLRLEVRDNGLGMSDEVRQRIFNPFVQGETNISRRYGGTGLGLVITQRLVEAMAGRIEVESQPDQGTRILAELCLPLAPGVELARPKVLQDLELLVMAEPDVVAILSAYAASAGAQVTSLQPAELLPGCARLHRRGAKAAVLIDAFGWEPEAERICRLIQQEFAGIEPLLLTRQSGKASGVGLGSGPAAAPAAGPGSATALNLNALRRDQLISALAASVGRESPPPLWQDHSQLAQLSRRSLEQARALGQVVLVADDNDTNRRVIQQQLAMLGYAADVAEDGRQALDRWRQRGGYPLVLTDCHMPVMDGYELSRGIRAEEAPGQRTPIIALTADALKGTSGKCYAAGMDDFLTKPMPLEQLQRMLERWMPLAAGPEGQGAGGAQGPGGPAAEEDVPGEAPADAPVDAPVDASALVRVLGVDDPAILARFYREFVDSDSKLKAQLDRALEQADQPQIAQLAHKLKAAARTLGAMALGEIYQALELAAKGDDPKALQYWGQELEVEYPRVLRWIEVHYP